ncbi:hypothetical protein NQZ68_012917 [Dissostichus eleginoides]|nr:hypothetical protein NQZ68_012917 [Dissostichus eleginoides]
MGLQGEKLNFVATQQQRENTLQGLKEAIVKNHKNHLHHSLVKEKPLAFCSRRLMCRDESDDSIDMHK